MFSLKEKKAIVTGGGSGIGRAIAVLFAKQGAEVHIVELSEENSTNVLEEINAFGGKAFAYSCNVANQQEVIATFGKIGDFNILVNNAGIMACPQWKTKDGFEMQFGGKKIIF